MAILSVAVSADTATNPTRNVALCLRSVLDSASMSGSFMSAFCVHPEVPRVVGELLLDDPRLAVRQNTAALIRRQTDTATEGDRYGHPSRPLPVHFVNFPLTLGSCSKSIRDVTPRVARLRAFFWPLISRLVRPAIVNGGNSTEVLELCFDMLQTLQESQSPSLSLKQLSSDWFDLLLDYTTTEVGLAPCSSWPTAFDSSPGFDPAYQGRRHCRWPHPAPARHCVQGWRANRHGRASRQVSKIPSPDHVRRI